MNNLVSVIMPSYNTAKYIEASINSVIAQTYENWELIIVDDCSTDNTAEIIAGIHDDRIRYFRNDKNSGAAISRNKALREAKGEWIAFLDSDDLWMPEKLEHQLRFMKEKHCTFSCAGRINIAEDGKELGQREYSPRCVGIAGMYAYCWPAALTVMYHAPTVGSVQIADLKKNNDYALWLKVIKKCKYCYYFDEVLGKYRVRKGSLSHGNMLKYIKTLYDMYRIGDQKGCIASFMLMTENIFFGAIKKIFYVKKYIPKGK